MSNAYQGFEVQKHRFMMSLKMLVQISTSCLTLQVLLFWLALKIPLFQIIDGRIVTSDRLPGVYRELTWKYPAARLVQKVGLNPTFHIYAPGWLKKLPHDNSGFVACRARELTQCIDYRLIMRAYRFPFFFSFLSWACIWPGFFFYARWATARIKDNEHIRGARLITEAEIRSKCDGSGILPIASIKLPESLSRRHLLVAGQTGSGKSTVMMQHVDAVQKARRRAIVNDYKGEMVQRFYRPGKDLILNPLDERGVGWTVFNEFRYSLDFTALTASLIPLGIGDERFWCAAAQDVLRGVLSYCWDRNLRTNAQLWKALTSPIAEIRDMCRATDAGQAGYTYIQDASSKQAVGVHAVLMSFVAWLEFAKDGSFSLRDWAEKGEDSMIFITNLDEASNIMRPHLSLFADYAGKRFLSFSDHTEPKRNVYLILDELGNLQRLPTVKKLLTLGRSKGVVVEIGIHDFASIESIYGREDAHTIINSCGSKLVLNLGDPEAAKFFSELASEEEYWESGTDYSISESEHRGGENHNRQVRVRKVIMPAEIMRLSVGEGYFMLPGGNPAPVTIPWTDVNRRKIVHKSFVLRSGLSLGELEAKDAETIAAQRVIDGPVPDALKAKVTENAIMGMRPMLSDEEEEKRQAQRQEQGTPEEKRKSEETKEASSQDPAATVSHESPSQEETP
ncbi:type IV secretion system DNA-binding domain-containing protein [Geomonas anaerohicana]|uniref:Type IV secretion system DNA-binding domain-containing protein n=1 Tax=Geomonas anaerohicana TaxID=2798583 RepID=A0ABS0YC96_9BACT|nr:type IV secretion system DNA-binding domain-containing protein [Geomonas anaerohicana]MBJ6749921.1 type IV secretion system DNA-binding domain-containing protein [Geomonas anaerohicana]